MNILLVGGTCSLMNNIILKLRKEGHRVFLLTGDKYKHSKYEKVFERYDFPYDSENLNEVIESVNPDVTILLGAFDTNYLWNGEERETVHFISHMVNILVAYSVVNFDTHLDLILIHGYFRYGLVRFSSNLVLIQCIDRH